MNEALGLLYILGSGEEVPEFLHRPPLLPALKTGLQSNATKLYSEAYQVMRHRRPFPGVLQWGQSGIADGCHRLVAVQTVSAANACLLALDELDGSGPI